jgi:signal peptidase I
MRRTQRWVSVLRQAALLVAVAAAWIAFAPRPFGGQTSYVIVAGASMEPALHQGDLVLTRQAPVYRVGQVVAYHHPQVGPVIHRVIAVDKSRYVLQGDHNNWIDSYAPKADDIVGASWFVVRRAGSLLAALRTPGGLALLSLLFGAILVSTVVVKAETPSRGRETRTVIRKNPPEGLLFALGVIGLGSLLLGIVAFTQPTASPVPGEIPYRQSATFAYEAGAPPTVYAGGALRTGDPIYDALVPTFDVVFEYSFAASAAAETSGTVALALEVSEPNGWSRRLPLQAETAFQGSRATAGGTVDMRTVRRMISLLESATGVDRDAYWVDVIATVHLEGKVDGHPFQALFAPHLPFALDDYQLYMRASDGPETAGSDPTQAEVEGSVAFMTLEPSTLTILGLEIPVTAARAVAVVGLVICLAAAAALLFPLYRARRDGEAEHILAEHASALISLSSPPPAGPAGIIEVQSFDDLLRLAEGTGQKIMHFAVDPEHHFYLREGEVLYHLVVAEPATAPEG